jgi:dihydrofolate reductase
MQATRDEIETPSDHRRSDVGAVLVHEFMSLDGVIDAPTWTAEFGFDPKMGQAIAGVVQRSRGILLGRTTFEMFAQSWPTRTAEDDPGAPFFNDTTKYVVSSTLTSPTWQHTTILGAYGADAIRNLKDEVDGDLYTSGSAQLVQAMLTDRLVDELHLFVYPVTRGAGPRLFPEGATPGKLTLATTETYENGVVYLAYRPQV